MTLYCAIDGYELPEYKYLGVDNGIHSVYNEDRDTFQRLTTKDFFKKFSFQPIKETEEEQHDETHPQFQDRLQAAEYFTTIYN